jgi:hypothetical protein
MHQLESDLKKSMSHIKVPNISVLSNGMKKTKFVAIRTVSISNRKKANRIQVTRDATEHSVTPNRFNTGMGYGNQAGNKYQGQPRQINNTYNQRGGFQNRQPQGDVPAEKNGFATENLMGVAHAQSNGVPLSAPGQTFNSYSSSSRGQSAFGSSRGGSGSYGSRGGSGGYGGGGGGGYGSGGAHGSYFEDWSKPIDKDERLEK